MEKKFNLITLCDSKPLEVVIATYSKEINWHDDFAEESMAVAHPNVPTLIFADTKTPFGFINHHVEMLDKEGHENVTVVILKNKTESMEWNRSKVSFKVELLTPKKRNVVDFFAHQVAKWEELTLPVVNVLYNTLLNFDRDQVNRAVKSLKLRANFVGLDGANIVKGEVDEKSTVLALVHQGLVIPESLRYSVPTENIALLYNVIKPEEPSSTETSHGRNRVQHAGRRHSADNPFHNRPRRAPYGNKRSFAK